DTPLHERRVAAGGTDEPGPEHWPERLGDQRLDRVLAERLEPQRDRPARPLVEKLQARHADQQQRDTGGEERDVLDEVEERLLAPLDVVEDDDEQPLRRRLLEGLAEGPRELVGRGRIGRLAEERADRRRGVLLRRQEVE